jgi:hypothetical protein
MKAAIQEKIKAKKARDEELLSKKPEDILKEADEGK